MPLATLTFSSLPSNTSTKLNPNSTAVAGPRLVTRFPAIQEKILISQKCINF